MASDACVGRRHAHGMRMIRPRLRRTARDDDLPLRVFGEVNVLQSIPLLLPQCLRLGGGGFPIAFRSLGGVGDFGLLLCECSHRREQQDGEEGEVDEGRFHNLHFQSDRIF
jgi:hypothetical protein